MYQRSIVICGRVSLVVKNFYTLLNAALLKIQDQSVTPSITASRLTYSNAM